MQSVVAAEMKGLTMPSQQDSIGAGAQQSTTSKGSAYVQAPTPTRSPTALYTMLASVAETHGHVHCSLNPSHVVFHARLGFSAWDDGGFE